MLLVRHARCARNTGVDKDLLSQVKRSSGIDVAVTAAELEEFVDRVFSRGWTSIKIHSPPDDNSAKGGLLSTGVKVAVLKRELPSSKHTKKKAGLGRIGANRV